MKIQQLSKKFKKNESGRSMVEMLGVLAVIGVLSVGGISGYKMAMEKMAVNEMNQVVNHFFLSIVSDDTVYDQLLTNGKFPSFSGAQASKANQKIATDLFVSSEGLKCSESKQTDSYAWGCVLPGASSLRYSVFAGYNASYGNLVAIKIASQSNLEILKKAARSVAYQIKNNSDMMKYFYFTAGNAGPLMAENFTDDKIDARFNNDNTYAGSVANGNRSVTFFFYY